MSSDYNAATWTASDLLADVFRACRMPSSGTTDYTTSIVLSMATQAIHEWGGHLLSTARDGRMATTILRASTDARDGDGNEFELPPMAAADAIDSVEWVPTSGQPFRLEVIPLGMESIFARVDETGAPTCYALKDGTIRVFPAPDTSGSLKVVYQRRHGALVLASDTTTITSVASASSTDTNITVAAIPSSVVANVWVDVIGKYYPYRTKLHGMRVVSAGGGVVRVSTALALFTAASTADDTLVIYGKTPVVQLPFEMREPLTRQISSRILAELGEIQAADVSDKMANAGAARVRDMLSPRTKSDRQKVISRHSLARGGVRRRFWSGSES